MDNRISPKIPPFWRDERLKELLEGFPEIASGGVFAGNMGFIEGWKGWMNIVAMSLKVVMQQGNKKPALTSKGEGFNGVRQI